MPAAVREALIGDAEAIARIHIDSWRHSYSGLVPGAFLESLSLAKWTADWIARLQPASRRNFVAEDQGVICGWASIGPARDADLNQDVGELYGIYVAPGRIRCSFGSQLYRRAEQELSKAGKGKISLWVLEGNSNARLFYGAQGLRPDGTAKIINLGGADLPELRYVKKIGRRA
jgi:GNAT superfamily N-acetyltransferase